jgi:hypothetical protein
VGKTQGLEGKTREQGLKGHDPCRNHLAFLYVAHPGSGGRLMAVLQLAGIYLHEL